MSKRHLAPYAPASATLKPAQTEYLDRDHLDPQSARCGASARVGNRTRLNHNNGLGTRSNQANISSDEPRQLDGALVLVVGAEILGLNPRGLTPG
jgi:hypothetical protein